MTIQKLYYRKNFLYLKIWVVNILYQIIIIIMFYEINKSANLTNKNLLRDHICKTLFNFFHCDWLAKVPGIIIIDRTDLLHNHRPSDSHWTT